MTIKPLADRVVVKLVEAEEKTKTGIILTAASQEKPQVAEVVAVGPGGLVDGEEVEITKALGSLIAFRVDGAAGETHTVEMRYEPATFHIGLTVSLVSLGILALLILSERKLKRIPLLRAIVSVPTSDHGATK